MQVIFNKIGLLFWSNSTKSSNLLRIPFLGCH